MKRLSVLIFYIGFNIQILPASAAYTSQFRHWYKDYANVFSELLRTNCSDEYDAYLRQEEVLPVRFLQDGKFRYVGPVVACLLDNTPETIKADMASAMIVLGLTPAILALTGSTLSEMTLLAVRRPVLAFLIALSSPFVNPLRTFDYTNPVASLGQSAAPIIMPPLTKTRRAILSLVEYVLVLAALANLATTTWQLATHTISNVNFDVIYMIPIWNCVIVAAFWANYVALRLRVYVDPTKSTEEDDEKPSARSRLFGFIQSEITPCASQPLLTLRWKRESYLFLAISLFTSILTSCYILYGTFVFSAVLFISNRDAVSVFGKLLATILVSRMILMVELAGMRSIARAHCKPEAQEGDVIKPD